MAPYTSTSHNTDGMTYTTRPEHCMHNQVKNLGAQNQRSHGDEGPAGMHDEEGGGDPHRETFNRLGSIIDFQAQQQASAGGFNFLVDIFTSGGSSESMLMTIYGNNCKRGQWLFC